MKKNIIKMLFLSLIVTAMISCDENDNEENIYTGDNFISFGTNTSASVLESASDIITITAYASVPNITSDINVDFEVINEQGTNSDYSIVDGKSQFNFGTGKYVDTIEIIPIDNLVEDGDKIINITLTSASDGSFIGHPGPDGKGKTFSVTLEDDDCAFTVQELGDSTWSGTDNATGNQGPNDSKVTTSFDGTNLLIEGLSYGWMTNTAYWNEVIVDSFPVIAEVDATGAITIAFQPLCNTTWRGDPQPPYSIEATGQYVSCSETMTISYDLYQNGAVLTSFTETLTKN